MQILGCYSWSGGCCCPGWGRASLGRERSCHGRRRCYPRVLLPSGVVGRERSFGSWMSCEGIGSTMAWCLLRMASLVAAATIRAVVALLMRRCPLERRKEGSLRSSRSFFFLNLYLFSSHSSSVWTWFRTKFLYSFYYWSPIVLELGLSSRSYNFISCFYIMYSVYKKDD